MGRLSPRRTLTGTGSGAGLGRLRLDPTTGLFRGARLVPSPNWDDRPPGQVAELIVIHGISLPPGQFGGPFIEQLFTNTLDPEGHTYFRAIAGVRVSSHLLIRRTGRWCSGCHCTGAPGTRGSPVIRVVQDVTISPWGLNLRVPMTGPTPSFSIAVWLP